MSGLRLGQLLLALSVVAGAGGHALLKAFVASLPEAVPQFSADYLLRAGILGRLLLVGLLLAVSFGAWLGALRYLQLSYAYAMASASVVVVAVLAATFLNETVTPKAWLGLILIAFGCALVAPTGGPH